MTRDRVSPIVAPAIGTYCFTPPAAHSLNNCPQYVAMMSTASDHHLIEPEQRNRLFAEMRRLIAQRPSGRITRHNLTILHVARKK